MKNTKMWIKAILLGALTVSLVACGDKEVENKENQNDVNEQIEQKNDEVPTYVSGESEEPNQNGENLNVYLDSVTGSWKVVGATDLNGEEVSMQMIYGTGFMSNPNNGVTFSNGEYFEHIGITDGETNRGTYAISGNEVTLTNTVGNVKNVTIEADGTLKLYNGEYIVILSRGIDTTYGDIVE